MWVKERDTYCKLMYVRGDTFMMENFPPLKIKKRERALYEVGKGNIPKVLYCYLVEGLSYRKIDKEILQFEKNTRGWESMGVMRHFGFTVQHKKIFHDVPEEKIIEVLKTNVPKVIPYIKNFTEYHTEYHTDEKHRAETGSILEKVEEGEQRLKIHKNRERNHKIIDNSKKKFKEKHNGELFCEVCRFNFADVYGKRGEDYIQGHHKKPISQMKKGDKTTIEDIAMVCPNCHAMLHRTPFLSIEELRKLVEYQKKNNK